MQRLLLLFLLMSVLPVKAQTAARSQKISYRRDVPAAVARLTPRGVKSYFWGAFQLKPKGPLYGLRLYAWNWRQYAMYVDLFLASHKGWERIRSCRIPYHGWRRRRIETALLWLDPLKQQKPIFKFRIFEYVSYEFRSKNVDTGGEEILLIFPQGLSGFYAVQGFPVGFWRASDTLGQSFYYGTADKRGLLQLITNETLNVENNPSPMTEDNGPYRITLYQWKDRQFVAVSSRRIRTVANWQSIFSRPNRRQGP
jgi:hypothetical protein